MGDLVIIRYVFPITLLAAAITRFDLISLGYLYLFFLFLLTRPVPNRREIQRHQVKVGFFVCSLVYSIATFLAHFVVSIMYAVGTFHSSTLFRIIGFREITSVLLGFQGIGVESFMLVINAIVTLTIFRLKNRTYSLTHGDRIHPFAVSVQILAFTAITLLLSGIGAPGLIALPYFLAFLGLFIYIVFFAMEPKKRGLVHFWDLRSMTKQTSQHHDTRDTLPNTGGDSLPSEVKEELVQSTASPGDKSKNPIKTLKNVVADVVGHDSLDLNKHEYNFLFDLPDKSDTASLYNHVGSETNPPPRASMSPMTRSGTVGGRYSKSAPFSPYAPSTGPTSAPSNQDFSFSPTRQRSHERRVSQNFTRPSSVGPGGRRPGTASDEVSNFPVTPRLPRQHPASAQPQTTLRFDYSSATDESSLYHDAQQSKILVDGKYRDKFDEISPGLFRSLVLTLIYCIAHITLIHLVQIQDLKLYARLPKMLGMFIILKDSVFTWTDLLLMMSSLSLVALFVLLSEYITRQRMLWSYQTWSRSFLGNVDSNMNMLARDHVPSPNGDSIHGDGSSRQDRIEDIEPFDPANGPLPSPRQIREKPALPPKVSVPKPRQSMKSVRFQDSLHSTMEPPSVGGSTQAFHRRSMDPQNTSETPKSSSYAHSVAGSQTSIPISTISTATYGPRQIQYQVSGTNRLLHMKDYVLHVFGVLGMELLVVSLHLARILIHLGTLLSAMLRPNILSFGFIILFVVMTILRDWQLKKFVPLLIIYSFAFGLAHYIMSIPGAFESQVDAYRYMGIEKMQYPVFSLLNEVMPGVISGVLYSWCYISPQLLEALRRRGTMQAELNRKSRAVRCMQVSKAVFLFLCDKIALAILFIVSLSIVNIIHAIFLLFFILFFSLAKTARSAWGVLVAYTGLVVMVLYAFAVIDPWINGPDHLPRLASLGSYFQDQPPSSSWDQIVLSKSEFGDSPHQPLRTLDGIHHPFHAITSCTVANDNLESLCVNSQSEVEEKDNTSTLEKILQRVMYLSPSSTFSLLAKSSMFEREHPTRIEVDQSQPHLQVRFPSQKQTKVSNLKHDGPDGPDVIDTFLNDIYQLNSQTPFVNSGASSDVDGTSQEESIFSMTVSEPSNSVASVHESAMNTSSLLIIIGFYVPSSHHDWWDWFFLYCVMFFLVSFQWFLFRKRITGYVRLTLLQASPIWSVINTYTMSAVVYIGILFCSLPYRPSLFKLGTSLFVIISLLIHMLKMETRAILRKVWVGAVLFTSAVFILEFVYQFKVIREWIHEIYPFVTFTPKDMGFDLADDVRFGLLSSLAGPVFSFIFSVLHMRNLSKPIPTDDEIEAYYDSLRKRAMLGAEKIYAQTRQLAEERAHQTERMATLLDDVHAGRIRNVSMVDPIFASKPELKPLNSKESAGAKSVPTDNASTLTSTSASTSGSKKLSERPSVRPGTKDSKDGPLSAPPEPEPNQTQNSTPSENTSQRSPPANRSSSLSSVLSINSDGHSEDGYSESEGRDEYTVSDSDFQTLHGYGSNEVSLQLQNLDVDDHITSRSRSSSLPDHHSTTPTTSTDYQEFCTTPSSSSLNRSHAALLQNGPNGQKTRITSSDSVSQLSAKADDFHIPPTTPIASTNPKPPKMPKPSKDPRRNNHLGTPLLHSSSNVDDILAEEAQKREQNTPSATFNETYVSVLPSPTNLLERTYSGEKSGFRPPSPHLEASRRVTPELKSDKSNTFAFWALVLLPQRIAQLAQKSGNLLHKHVYKFVFIFAWLLNTLVHVPSIIGLASSLIILLYLIPGRGRNAWLVLSCYTVIVYICRYAFQIGTFDRDSHKEMFSYIGLTFWNHEIALKHIWGEAFLIALCTVQRISYLQWRIERTSHLRKLVLKEREEKKRALEEKIAKMETTRLLLLQDQEQKQIELEYLKQLRLQALLQLKTAQALGTPPVESPTYPTVTSPEGSFNVQSISQSSSYVNIDTMQLNVTPKVNTKGQLAGTPSNAILSDLYRKYGLVGDQTLYQSLDSNGGKAPSPVTDVSTIENLGSIESSEPNYGEPVVHISWIRLSLYVVVDLFRRLIRFIFSSFPVMGLQITFFLLVTSAVIRSNIFSVLYIGLCLGAYVVSLHSKRFISRVWMGFIIFLAAVLLWEYLLVIGKPLWWTWPWNLSEYTDHFTPEVKLWLALDGYSAKDLHLEFFVLLFASFHAKYWRRVTDPRRKEFNPRIVEQVHSRKSRSQEQLAVARRMEEEKAMEDEAYENYTANDPTISPSHFQNAGRGFSYDNGDLVIENDEDQYEYEYDLDDGSQPMPDEFNQTDFRSPTSVASNASTMSSMSTGTSTHPRSRPLRRRFRLRRKQNNHPFRMGFNAKALVEREDMIRYEELIKQQELKQKVQSQLLSNSVLVDNSNSVSLLSNQLHANITGNVTTALDSVPGSTPHHDIGSTSNVFSSHAPLSPHTDSQFEKKTVQDTPSMKHPYTNPYAFRMAASPISRNEIFSLSRQQAPKAVDIDWLNAQSEHLHAAREATKLYEAIAANNSELEGGNETPARSNGISNNLSAEVEATFGPMMSSPALPSNQDNKDAVRSSLNSNRNLNVSIVPGQKAAGLSSADIEELMRYDESLEIKKTVDSVWPVLRFIAMVLMDKLSLIFTFLLAVSRIDMIHIVYFVMSLVLLFDKSIFSEHKSRRNLITIRLWNYLQQYNILVLTLIMVYQSPYISHYLDVSFFANQRHVKWSEVIGINRFRDDNIAAYSSEGVLYIILLFLLIECQRLVFESSSYGDVLDYWESVKAQSILKGFASAIERRNTRLAAQKKSRELAKSIDREFDEIMESVRMIEVQMNMYMNPTADSAEDEDDDDGKKTAVTSPATSSTTSTTAPATPIPNNASGRSSSSSAGVPMSHLSLNTVEKPSPQLASEGVISNRTPQYVPNLLLSSASSRSSSSGMERDLSFSRLGEHTERTSGLKTPLLGPSESKFASDMVDDSHIQALAPLPQKPLEFFDDSVVWSIPLTPDWEHSLEKEADNKKRVALSQEELLNLETTELDYFENLIFDLVQRAENDERQIYANATTVNEEPLPQSESFCDVMSPSEINNDYQSPTSTMDGSASPLSMAHTDPDSAYGENPNDSDFANMNKEQMLLRLHEHEAILQRYTERHNSEEKGKNERACKNAVVRFISRIKMAILRRIDPVTLNTYGFTEKTLRIVDVPDGYEKPEDRSLLHLLYLLSASHSQVIVLTMFIITLMSSPTFLNLVVPLGFILFGLLNDPRPSQAFFQFVLVFTSTITAAQFIFQLPLFCVGKDYSSYSIYPDPLCVSISETDPTSYVHFAYLFGIYKAESSTVTLLICQLLSLIALVWHRNVLLSRGVWFVSEEHLGDPIQEQSRLFRDRQMINAQRKKFKEKFQAYQAHALELGLHSIQQVYAKACSIPLPFSHRVLSIMPREILDYYYGIVPRFGKAIEEVKIGADYYFLTFIAELICAIWILLLYSAMASTTIQAVGTAFTRNFFQGDMVLNLFLQIVCIIFGRVCYLRRSLSGNLILLWLSALYWYISIFFIWPSSSLRGLTNNSSLTVFFLFKTMTFILFGLQIRKGFPSRDTPNVQALTKNISLIRYLAFRVYRAIPFVFELRVILDWYCSPTSLDLWDLFKIEDIYATLNIAKRLIAIRNDKPRGAIVDRSIKLAQGLLVFCLLILILFVPILLFSSANPASAANNVTSMESTIQVVTPTGSFPFMTISAVSSLGPAPREDIDFLRKSGLITSSDKDDAVQFVELSPFSDSYWTISPGSLQHLIRALENSLVPGSGQILVEATYKFHRNLPVDSPTISLPIYTALAPQDVSLLLDALIQDPAPPSFSVKVPQVIPTHFRLPSTGEPAPILPREDYLDATLILQTDPSGGATSRYWSMYEYEKDSQTIPPATRPVSLILVSNPVWSSSILASFSYSIIAIYTIILFTVGQFVRQVFAGSTQRLYVEELPDVDRLMRFCQGIYIARAHGLLVREEELFKKLVRIYRSPEKLVLLTARNPQLDCPNTDEDTKKSDGSSSTKKPSHEKSPTSPQVFASEDMKSEGVNEREPSSIRHRFSNNSSNTSAY